MSDDKQGASVSEGQASPPTDGRRVFSFREGWKVRGRELNALYDVLGPATAKRNGDPAEDLKSLVAERDQLRRFAAWVADHRLVEGVYADAEHPYDEWVTPDDEEAEFERLVERAKEALGVSPAGGSVGPEQADAGLLAIHDALVRSDAHPELTAASRRHLNVVGLVQRIEEMKSEVERLRAPREVTDEMVELGYGTFLREMHSLPNREAMRAALRAALSEGERHG